MEGLSRLNLSYDGARFDVFRSSSRRQPTHLPVQVVWDRRQGDRRTASTEPNSERRKADRRQKPPFTWEASDFVVAATKPSASGKNRE
jgi:hypothetical protein